MSLPDLSRRTFLSLPAALPLGVAYAADDWVDLFDGQSLTGWKANENPSSWKVAGGALCADGPRSHLFYDGPVKGAAFRNFELEAEVKTAPGCNSGIYFHTTLQPQGWLQKGFEVQVNNTATGEAGYSENKKTGSLYGVRNVYKQFVQDGEWFKLNILVRGKSVQIRLNGMLLVDFVEPTPAVLVQGDGRGRALDRGTFALQCHDAGSKAFFRRVRVKPLADEQPAVAAPVVDETWRKLLALGAQNFPVVDYHVHLKSGLTIEAALERSRRDGIFYGVAVNCGKNFPVETDEGVRAFFETMKGQPTFVAMQAEGREWMQMFSHSAAALFDYTFTDSMTWSDNRGKRMRTWLANEVGTVSDPQEFMDTLVERAVGIMDKEPIDIYVNPTYVPDVLAKDYDTLWTDARMKKVVAALKRNGVAMEINNRYQLPSANFIKMAKAEGVKFAFGTNNMGPDDLKRCEYGLRMIEECKLGWKDFFTPGRPGERAIDRKKSTLRP